MVMPPLSHFDGISPKLESDGKRHDINQELWKFDLGGDGTTLT